MSLLQYCRFVAFFLDDRNEQVGFKVFAHSWGNKGLSIKTFDYDGKTYNFKPKASRLVLDLKTTVFFDTYIYVYHINHPDPLVFSDGSFKPMFDPEVYKNLLQNKQTIDLIKAGRGGLNLDWRWIVGGLVIIAIIYYFVSSAKGKVPTELNSTINNSIQTVIHNSTGRFVI